MSNHIKQLGDLEALAKAGPAAFPFTCELSLAPLIDFWVTGGAGGHAVKRTLSRMVEQELRNAPELLGPIHDLSLVERHRNLVDMLMAVVFPPAFWDQEYGAALIPFQLRSVYATPSFERLMMGEGGTLRARVDTDLDTMNRVRLSYAYWLVLRRVYGLDVPLDIPIVFTVTDPETGLDRHFKTQFDSRFIEVTPVGSVGPLPDEVRGRVQAYLEDPRALLPLLPPERFVIRGFTVIKAVDVTDQAVLSSLKRDLIDKESVVSTTRFQALEAKLQVLFRQPRLRLGLAAIDGDQVLLLNHGARLEHSCIFADSVHHTTAEFAGSIYDRAVRQGRPLIVEDLATYPDRTLVEDEILRAGVRNVVVAPLHYQDQVIGTLELESSQAGDFDSSQLLKLREVVPLFSMAVKRSMEELESRIQAFIKETCTAIHPSVEWRFRKAVLHAIEASRAGLTAPSRELEPIVFDGVYPLYGLSDIRGSSTQRALAIQADLLEQLGRAREAVQAARASRPLPALDELAFRIDRRAAAIETGLRTGDEVAAITFLRSEVEPLFDHLHGFGPEARRAVEAYRAALDPRLGAVYRRRKDFEDSITLLNETISSYLDLEEQAAQAMFPHYFEKQKTDGVDYGIYIGASLLDDGRFDSIYLRNLRLWQLMVACGIAIRAERLKSRLAIPLETTNLILVHNTPLSIRFRFDEKRFDVDGAYNIRYEIVKKRIDKATLRDGGGRLTQPGRIAIVYSQPREATEYRQYIEYLQHLQYLGPDVEDLELEELQGAQGLRALRVAVELANPRLDGPVSLSDLAGAGAARAE